MDLNYIRSYLVANGKYFPSSKLGTLGRILEDSQTSEHVINKRFFSPVFLTIIFWIFWPFQLFDRLLLKDWFWGWLKLFLPVIVGFILYENNISPFQVKSAIFEGYDIIEIMGACAIILWAIWTIVDGFTIYKRTKKANYRTVLNALDINNDSYVYNTPKESKVASKVGAINENFATWKKTNPNSSINDFYRRK